MSELETAINRQESVLRAVLELELGAAPDTLSRAGHVWLVGTGTSQHAAELGAGMLELAGLDARWASAAAFARRRVPVERSDAIVLITHTGETAFARDVRRQAREAHVPLISVTGEGVDWPEAVAVAPRESSETYSASYTAALLFLARLAGALGAETFDLAALGATVDAAATAAGQSWGGVSRPERLLVFAGAGPFAVTAREGALKLREAARLPSEGFEAEYLLHGSAVPLTAADRLVLLQPGEDPDQLLRAIGIAAAAEGVEVQTVAVNAPVDPLLAQIPLTVFLQGLASHFAASGGHDPDEVIRGAWSEAGLWEIGAPDQS